jgi:hypothetical protein
MDGRGCSAIQRPSCQIDPVQIVFDGRRSRNALSCVSVLRFGSCVHRIAVSLRFVVAIFLPARTSSLSLLHSYKPKSANSVALVSGVTIPVLSKVLRTACSSSQLCGFVPRRCVFPSFLFYFSLQLAFQCACVDNTALHNAFKLQYNVFCNSQLRRDVLLLLISPLLPRYSALPVQPSPVQFQCSPATPRTSFDTVHSTYRQPQPQLRSKKFVIKTVAFAWSLAHRSVALHHARNRKNRWCDKGHET